MVECHGGNGEKLSVCKVTENRLKEALECHASMVGCCYKSHTAQHKTPGSSKGKHGLVGLYPKLIDFKLYIFRISSLNLL